MNEKTQQVHKAYAMTAEWQRIEMADDRRVGTIIQNQSGNGANILISCNGAPTQDFAALEIAPGATLYEDIVQPNGDIWAKSAAVLATMPTLTIVLKYRG